ncbi:serine protease inhibitor 2-like [Anopheles ziemanni]|uniref:serine protease inhibitor 2-like n=1 Tax=Anopheles ziemanni TaxID=345580 RepID=UPI00265EC326|nr:serine protease inhibitor 2-like [Anopheles ziemanni]
MIKFTFVALLVLVKAQHDVLGPYQQKRQVEFELQWIKRVFQNSDSNVVLSPFSIQMLLVLLNEATASTNEELHQVIDSFGQSRSEGFFKDALASAQEQNEHFDLNIATNLFVDDFIDATIKFQQIARVFYDALVEKVSYSKPTEAAAIINRWVSDSTKGRLREIVTPDGLEGAVITLINVIYFKGLWTFPFPEIPNNSKPFNGSRGKTSNAMYMEQNGHFYYDNSAELGAQILRLPYRGNKLAMYFILPNQGNSVQSVLDRLDNEVLHRALWYMDESEVNVTIPRFKIDFSETLNEPLQAMGIKEIFSVNASLSLLARGRGVDGKIRVSRILQKAAITINEFGSETQSSAETSLTGKFGGNEVQTFTANRPFIFFIEDEAFGTMLFAGKVEDPQIIATVLMFVVNAQRDAHGPYQQKRQVAFDLQFLKEVFQKQNSNVVLSPFSVKILLTLIYEASDTNFGSSVSQTNKELNAVIQPEGIEKTRSFYKDLLASAQEQNEDFDLNIATNFYVDDFIEVINKYQQIAKAHYDASVEKVSYSKPTEAAAIINRWVSDSTKGRLREIVTPDGLEGAVITLINVIYFKGLWTFPFPEIPNNSKPFYGSRGKTSNAMYMEQNGHFYYDNSAELGAQILRLPYRGNKLAMYFILPNQGNSVQSVLDRLDNEVLHRALWYMDESEVNVTIPRFKIDFSETLNEPLQAIGIKEIFSVNASLPLLARGRGARGEVRVSRIFQKAGITINELGSEAYAATEIQLVNKFGGDGVQIFTANRPFIFFIEDEAFGTMLFAGKVEDPSI